KLVHIAVTAMKLQAPIDDSALKICEPVFRHRSCGGVETAIEMALDAVVDEDASDSRLGFAFGKLELGILKFRDAFAKSMPLLDEIDRYFERPFDPRHRIDRDHKPFLRKLAHQHREALSFLGADEGGCRNPHIVEEELGGIIGFQSDLVEIPSALETFKPIGLDGEERDAPGALL